MQKKPLFIVASFVFAIFFLLIFQFYKIQIIEGSKWQSRASIQHHYTVIEPFMRGRFFANSSLRFGHPEEPQVLVMDVPKFHLFVDSLSIPAEYKKEVVSKISSFTKNGAQKKKIGSDIYKKSHSRKILTWLDWSEKEKIESWWKEYAKKRKIAKNALYFSLDYRRSYPFGSLLGQVLHTVQEEKEAQTLESYPTGGLEMYFNKYLKGKPGSRLIVRSPRHSLDVGKVVSVPDNGADIYLTIDRYLQAIAEEELEKGVKNAGAKNGWAVMMDPYTGEILAVAQYPFFDLSRYKDYFNNKKMEEHTRLKAVTDAFEPGSIMKPITLAICLKANEELKKVGKAPLFSPYEKIFTGDGKVPGRAKPIKDLRRHNYLNMFLGVQKSSDVYMAKLIQRVIEKFGPEWYRAELAKFGFGKKTNVEFSAETPGLLPTPGKMHPNGKLEWSTDTPYSLDMGYNILVNSMQMIRSYAIIVNGGFEVKPTLVRKIVKADETIFENKFETGKEPILSESIRGTLIQAMKYVTKPRGTAPSADIPGYTEAGKTGTAEKIVGGRYSHEKNLASFIGFAPVTNPRFILIITIDEPRIGYVKGVGPNQQGGTCAAPVFREIGKRTLEYLGVAPDDPFGYPGDDPRHDFEKADWMPEVKKLTELYQKWNGK